MQKIRIAIPAELKDVPNYINALTHLDAEYELVDKDVNVDEFDGLLMPGGVDVNPKYYGEEINGSEEIDDELDERQFAVIDKFVKAKKPILGICRGHQILNIYFKGTLIQHLDNYDKHVATNHVDNINTLDLDENGFLYKIYKQPQIVTNSSHHQAIKKLGEGLKVIAKCGDVVEAMYHESLPIITVQFHPERMCFEKTNPQTVDGSEIISYFLDMCK